MEATHNTSQSNGRQTPSADQFPGLERNAQKVFGLPYSELPVRFQAAVRKVTKQDAAEEMLERLKALTLWDSGDEDFIAAAAEHCTVNGISTIAYEEMLYQQARATIAKAEGRS
jgi:hypothetical protein